MRSSLILIFFFIISTSVFAMHEPDSAFNREMAFIQHLVRLNKTTEAIEYGKMLLNQSLITESMKDTLNFTIGWLYYTQKELDSSAKYLLTVSGKSPVYHKSLFFSAYNLIYLNRLNEADSILNLITDVNDLLFSLRNFEKSGISLLKRDEQSYRTYASLYHEQYFAIDKQVGQLNSYADRLMNFKPKSPGIAALMSTVIPGSGKIYAGKTGEGIAAFLVVTALSLISYENYRKDGLTNFKTLFFGGVAGIYYIGNIVGSAATARVKNNEFNHEMDQRILFDIHIPLRTIFN